MKKNTYCHDNRSVLTLDAGGTNLVFNAVQANKEILSPIVLPAQADDLDKCLANIVTGFEEAIKHLKQAPYAISFAFPGPADYANGIIGDLPNFPSFRGGVALGPYLQEKFGIPVFINNDGDLFAYGEACAGALPHINQEFEKRGIPRKYNNLLGITLGTGTGGGVVHNGELFRGDNGAAAEVWVIRNKRYPEAFSEEGAALRSIKRSYRILSKDTTELTPKDIAEIAEGTRAGNQQAAREAFEEFGDILGNLIANVNTVVDGLVVLGGGVANAHKWFMPALLRELNGTISRYDGLGSVPRTESKAYDLTDPQQAEQFFVGGTTQVTVPFSQKKVVYNQEKKVGVTLSKLGTSSAVSIGAYAFALNEIDKQK